VFYSPDQTWPSHPDKVWNQFLTQAKTRGWHLRLNSDHSWGTLVCRVGVAASDACQFTIFSSGAGTENAAKAQLVKINRGCTHRPKPVDAEGAFTMLKVASSLLDAANQILIGVGDVREAENLLDVAESTMNKVDAMQDALNRAAELDGSGRESIREGAITAVRAGVDPGDPPQVEVILDKADAHLSETRSVVRGMSGSDPRSVRRRLAVERERLSDLRLMANS